MWEGQKITLEREEKEMIDREDECGAMLKIAKRTGCRIMPARYAVDFYKESK